MTDTEYLTDHFLIAMPQLDDPNFSQTVTYLCQHDAQGAMGITINRPLGIGLGELLAQLEIRTDDESLIRQPVYSGGPVQTSRGFILHSPASLWDSTLEINPQLSLTTSSDIFEAMVAGNGPEKTFVALGYSGWGAGQLEAEIMNNAWLHTRADYSILFDTEPGQRWPQAAAQLGIDINTLSHEPGHA